jgi:hypothetical protein
MRQHNLITELQDLLAHVEKTDGPDRELDADLWWTFDHGPASTCFNNGALGLPRQLPATLPIPAGLGRAGVQAMAPAYSASLDATLRLVERVLPGWGWSVGNVAQGGHAYLMRDAGATLVGGAAASPAIALLVAMLKVLIAQESQS